MTLAKVATTHLVFNNAEFDALDAEFQLAKNISDAVAISQKMEAILFDEMPYLVLFNVPTLEVYKSTVEIAYHRCIRRVNRIYRCGLFRS